MDALLYNLPSDERDALVGEGGPFLCFSDAGHREEVEMASWAFVIFAWTPTAQIWRVIYAEAHKKSTKGQTGALEIGGIVNMFELAALVKAAQHIALLCRGADTEEALEGQGVTDVLDDNELLALPEAAQPWLQPVETTRAWS